MTDLLLKTGDIPRLTKLSGNIDIDSLVPFIYTAQKNEIKRVLGLDLYNKILTDFIADTLADNYLIIYDEFIVDMLAYYSAANYMKFAPYQISNGGVYKHAPENAEIVDSLEVDKLITRYYSLGEGVELVFKEWIKDNPVPEYTQSCKNKSFKFPWML